jgi:heat shock factor-binding protein 1
MSAPSFREGSFSADPKNVQELTAYIESALNEMQGKYQEVFGQVTNRIDEMGSKIDELEKDIAALMTQAGVDDAPRF